MKTKIGKEIALLCLPILAIGAAGLFLTRQQARSAPPEDLSLGPPRVVVGKWRETELTPFDVYRGYSRKIEVETWVGGTFPPLKGSGRPGAVEFHRETQPDFPLPQLFYKVAAGKWRVVNSKGAEAAVETESNSGGENLRDQMRQTLCIRTSSVRGAARLSGRLGGIVIDREKFPTGSALSSDIVRQFSVQSKQINIPLDLSHPANTVVRECPLKLKSAYCQFVSYDKPVRPASRVQLMTYLQVEWLRPWNDRRSSFASGAYKKRLFDATGKLVASTESFGFSPANNPTEFGFSMDFIVTNRDWKSWEKPLILQTSLSIDNCWPLEVNVQLRDDNHIKPPVKSKLSFRK